MTKHTTFPSSSKTPNPFGTLAFERRKEKKEVGSSKKKNKKSKGGNRSVRHGEVDPS